MNRTLHILSHLVSVALSITVLVVVTGAIWTRASLDMDIYLYGQVVVMFVGLTALFGAIYSAVFLVDYWLERQVPLWFDGDSPMNSRFEGYWEDHQMGIDTLEQWSCGQRTLLHDLQFVAYIVRRWVFRTRYDLWSNVVGAYYRSTDKGFQEVANRF